MMDGGEAQPLRYAATPGLFRIAVKNLMLTLLTLGIYRFWAKTNLRRYMWRQVVLGDDALEYTGTGKELFMGFLIVIAILAPFALAFGVAQQLLMSDPRSAAALQIFYLAALIVLSVIALFRARRYRLSRTAWRGIHAGQDGNTLGYVGRWLLWKALAVVTLGLVSPWGRTALQRYLMRATRFGDLQVSFVGSGSPLFWRWLLLVLGSIAPLVAFVVINREFRLPSLASSDPAFLAFIMVQIFQGLQHKWLLSLAPAVAVLGWLWYRVREFRYFVACTRLGDAPLRSTAKARWIGLIYLAFLFFGYLLPLILIILGFGVLGTLTGDPRAVNDPGAITDRIADYGQLIAFAMVFVLFAGHTLASALWLQPRLLRHLCRTTTIGNLSVLDQVAQSTAPRQRFGEGLADSFDIG